MLQNRKGYVGKRAEHVVNMQQCNAMIVNILKVLCRAPTSSRAPTVPDRGAPVSKVQRVQRKPVYFAAGEVVKKIDRQTTTASAARESLHAALKKSLQMMLKHGMGTLALPEVKAPFLPPMGEAVDLFKTVDVAAPAAGEQEKNEKVNGTLDHAEDKVESKEKANPDVGKQKYTLVLDLDETLVHYVEVQEPRELVDSRGRQGAGAAGG